MKPNTDHFSDLIFEKQLETFLTNANISVYSTQLNFTELQMNDTD